MKFLFILAILSVVVVVAYSIDLECSPSIKYKHNYCNSCSCVGGLQARGCTQNNCPDVDKKLLDCKVGTTWMNDCNRCWCHSEKSTFCEDKKCSATHE